MIMYFDVLCKYVYGFASNNALVKEYYWIAREMYSPVCILSSIALFMAFKSFKNNYYSVINSIAKHTFGIYLFQCHNETIPVLWRGLLIFLLGITRGLVFFFCFKFYEHVL